MNNVDFNSWTLEKRVVAMIAYFDIFNLPVDRVFLLHFLLGGKPDSVELDKVLDQSPQIDSRDGLFFLKGREILAEHYRSKVELAARLHKRAEFWAGIFRFIPFVQAVAVCNYISFNAVDPDSDIDLFIITKKHRIFTARFLVTVLMQLLGIRRHGNKVKGRFCLSFYISEQAKDLSEMLLENGDIYMAYWMRALRPVYERTGSEFESFARENEHWLSKYFDQSNRTTFVNINPIVQGKFILSRAAEKLFDVIGGNQIEKFLKGWSVMRYEKIKNFLKPNASIEISSKRLKYHNLDKRMEFRAAWLERLKRLKFAD
jgi:hypothetical protein